MILKLYIFSSVNVFNILWIVYVWFCSCIVIWLKVNYFWFLKGKILYFIMYYDKLGVSFVNKINLILNKNKNKIDI